VGEPREDKDNGHIPSAVTGCLQFGEDATSMTRRLGAEAPKKKLVYQKKSMLPEEVGFVIQGNCTLKVNSNANYIVNIWYFYASL
jgi:hypothetical protein